MGRRHRFRYGRDYQMRDIQRAIWLIGLGILFLTRWWWPGILILIGVSMIVGALVRERIALDERDTVPPGEPLPPIAGPPAEPFTPAPPVFVSTPAAPVNKPLPGVCPNCGAGKFERLGPERAKCWHCGSEINLGA
jgi:hypothetical protein